MRRWRMSRPATRCGEFIPEGRGLFLTIIHRLVCTRCKPHVIALEKDYTRSHRGRHRTPAEFLRAIRGEKAAALQRRAGDRADDRAGASAAGPVSDRLSDALNS